MFLIVGLGNPEKEYENTRHNMGFCTLNKISKEYNIEINKNKFNSLYGIGEIQGEKVVLVKPQTYMNLSGEAVRKFVDFYKIEKDKIILIYDDIDVDIGSIKIRKQGSAGSHKGMISVISMLNTEQFARVRIGIGRPIKSSYMIEYVIGKLSKEEKEKLEPGIEKAKEAVEIIIKNGVDIAMNKFNNKEKKEE